jgi:6-phospho-beta-glucosidase
MRNRRGGGLTYAGTHQWISGAQALPVTELAGGIDPQRLEIVGGFAQRMVAAQGAPFEVVLSDDQRAAVKDARYVCTQLRVGMMEARRNDEYLGLRHGLIGQETTGVGGMAKALRTIPVCWHRHDMRAAAAQRAVNFTNPRAWFARCHTTRLWRPWVYAMRPST